MSGMRIRGFGGFGAVQPGSVSRVIGLPAVWVAKARITHRPRGLRYAGKQPPLFRGDCRPIEAAPAPTRAPY